MTLASLQQSFWRAMRDSAPTNSLEGCFRGDARLSALDRLLIYRRAYWARQVDALRDEFRRLARLIGEDDFACLMKEYLDAHPSPDPRIEMIGRELPAFLGAHESPERRCLADLAAFEWAEVEVLLAEDPPEVTIGFEVPSTVFPACTLAMVPALRVLSLVTDPLAGPGRGAPSPTAFAIWRRGFSVQHRRLDPDEQEAATAALADAPVADVCESFRRAPDSAERASEVIRSWLSGGWVSRIVPPVGITPT